MDFEVDISNDQSEVHVDEVGLRRAVAMALHIEQVDAAVLSISIVDNAVIHQINRDHLQHDYPTDVISFQLDWSMPPEVDEVDADDLAKEDSGREPLGPESVLRAAGGRIEGEIIASAEMAADVAADLAGSTPWTANDELTLYVIHGLLHICGYDDMSPEEQHLMRDRERAILNALGLHPTYPGDEKP